LNFFLIVKPAKKNLSEPCATFSQVKYAYYQKSDNDKDGDDDDDCDDDDDDDDDDNDNDYNDG
jgi:hypothetical protein